MFRLPRPETDKIVLLDHPATATPLVFVDKGKNESLGNFFLSILL